MEATMLFLAIAAGVCSLICWVIAVVTFFKAGQFWPAIIGILCAPFAFIWGWMQVKPLGLQTVMLFWTIFVIAAVVINVVVFSTSTPIEIKTGHYEQ